MNLLDIKVFGLWLTMRRVHLRDNRLPLSYHSGTLWYKLAILSKCLLDITVLGFDRLEKGSILETADSRSLRRIWYIEMIL